MSVEIEQVGPCRWRVTAQPDSGKAFWSVDVSENHRSQNPMGPVLAAMRRAWRIDRAFSSEQIDCRVVAQRRRLANGAKTVRQFMEAINQVPSQDANKENQS